MDKMLSINSKNDEREIERERKERKRERENMRFNEARVIKLGLTLMTKKHAYNGQRH